ncbi:MAG: glycosyltransferase family 1 protein [Planctomycetota bacterium]
MGPGYSGARTRLLRLLESYQELERRHDLVLFVRRDAGLADWARSHEIECVPVDPPPRAEIRWLTGTRCWRRRLRAVRAGAFQAETLPLPRSLHVPMLATIHDLRAFELPTNRLSPRSLYARTLLPRSLRRARRIIAVSATTRSGIVSELRCPKERVVVVPNGVDESELRIADPERAGCFRDRFGLTGRFVLALGHLEPRKNLSLLVRALHLLREAPGFLDLSLVLAGRDECGLSPRLSREARRLQVPLVLTGPISDQERAAALRSASCLAVPSRLEGFGMVPLEAMAVGCPVVGARAGALPEVIGDAGLLVDPTSAEELARELGRLLSDEDLVSRLKERGRIQAGRFRWKKSAELLRDVHDAVFSAESDS